MSKDFEQILRQITTANVGDRIYEGQINGKTGGTKGTLGAGSSTDAHLHFELYIPDDENKNIFSRTPVDP